MIYQPLYGFSDLRYQRECEDRYEQIADHCRKYSRPFTVFDLGCNMGYFGFRLREEFPNCIYIGLDDKTPMRRALRDNRGLSQKMMWLETRISLEDLERLASCETFDVVLALAVVHHFANPVRALKACCDLGGYTFVEVPSEDDEHALNAGRLGALHEALGDSEPFWHCKSHTTAGAMRPWYLFENEEFIEWQYHDAPEKNQKDGEIRSLYRVRSGFSRKDIEIMRHLSVADVSNPGATKTIRVYERREFHQGMNLWNANWLHCTWPEDLDQRGLEVATMYKDIMEDWFPWNFIVAGEKITPIDYGNKKNWRVEDLREVCHPDDLHIIKEIEDAHNAANV